MPLLPRRRPRADVAAEQFRSAAAAAHDAYMSTVGSHSDRLAAVTTAHLRALAERDLLAVHPPGVDVPTVEEDAQWLAAQSGHPRFTDEGMWRQLLTPDAEHLIRMAFRLASEQRGAAAKSAFGREAQVRDRLLRYICAGGCNVGHDK